MKPFPATHEVPQSEEKRGMELSVRWGEELVEDLFPGFAAYIFVRTYDTRNSLAFLV